MAEEEYNGWTNWETWNVNLWLSNDQNLYNETKELLSQEYEYNFQKDEALEDFVDELIDNGVIKDKISIHRVNWTEIVKAFLEE